MIKNLFYCYSLNIVISVSNIFQIEMSKLSIFPEKFINIEYQIYFLHNIYMYNSNHFTDLSTNIHYLRSIVHWQLPYEMILSLEDCFQIAKC